MFNKNELVEIGLMKKEHALYTKTGFEDSFDSRILVTAMKKIAERRGEKI